MNKPTIISDKLERVLIETDEFIFPIRIEQIQYAKIVDKQFIQFYGLDSNYQVVDQKNNIIPLLLKAGFIRIQASLYVNPKQISEYKIKDQLVEFSSGKSIAIQSRYKNRLMTYFAAI